MNNQYNLLAVASLSKDNSTKVGAIMKNHNGSIVSFGYNGLPRGMDDKNESYQNKELDKIDDKTGLKLYKYDLFEHAEMNCIYNFARENTKLSEDGNYIVISSIITIDDARAIVSTGVKKVYTMSLSNNKELNQVINHLFDECAVEIDLKGEHKMFSCLDQLSYDLDGYCAIFSKHNSLISIGYHGFSDFLNKKLNTNNKNDYFESNKEKLKQSSIKNCIYNLIADKVTDQYEVEVSLSPCLNCSIGLISSGIVNIKYTNDSQTSTTSKIWNKETKSLKSFMNFLNVNYKNISL